jgi:hypothetical protein
MAKAGPCRPPPVSGCRPMRRNPSGPGKRQRQGDWPRRRSSRAGGFAVRLQYSRQASLAEDDAVGAHVLCSNAPPCAWRCAWPRRSAIGSRPGHHHLCETLHCGDAGETGAAQIERGRERRAQNGAGEPPAQAPPALRRHAQPVSRRPCAGCLEWCIVWARHGVLQPARRAARQH